MSDSAAASWASGAIGDGALGGPHPGLEEVDDGVGLHVAQGAQQGLAHQLDVAAEGAVAESVGRQG